MPEIELKLRVPAEKLAAVQRAVATRTAQTHRLRAIYFDTPDRALARHRIGLRQRQEGRRWVQTCKALGADLITRLEHDVPLGAAPAADALPDLTLHRADAAVAERLQAALADVQGPLVARYRTDIRRIARRARHEGAEVELALDVGSLSAGGDTLPVAELEFECLKGSPAAMVALAARWAERFGLWLDPRSKAQQGDWLAEGRPAVPPRRFVPAAAAVPGGASQGVQAFADALAAALAPVTEGLAVLADAVSASPPAAAHGHLHQVRVGLRRLRVLGRVLAVWLPESEQSEALSWSQATAERFRALAGAHDDGALAQLLAPALADAGLAVPASWCAVPVAPGAAWLGSEVRSPAMQAWLLQTLAWQARLRLGESGVPLPPAANDDIVADALAARALQREHRRLRRLARRFGELDEEAVHDLRKAIKRLRYALALSRACWLPRKRESPGRLGRLEQRLSAAQDALGDYTDLLMARDRLASAAAATAESPPALEPAVVYAQGWVNGRLPLARQACEQPLALLLRAPVPWKRRLG
jgi:triphosphatase